MTPGAGERRVRFVGDCLNFTLAHPRAREWAEAGWTARLRTNLGRAAAIRHEVIQSKFQKIPLAGASWRDIPMRWADGEWQLALPLAEVGWFKAKPYALDPRGFQHWPDGDDFGVSVHPNWARTANTIYCAFARMFGETRSLTSTTDLTRKSQMAVLDQLGYTVIPPSGKLRDLTRQLPHIFETLGCRILHLLPVNPTPTTFARFGRFGSPYAAEDLTGIDPALVEFDKRTTGVEQFQELTSAVHARGGRVFLDIVINHTGWGSWLQENHPEWFVRKPDGHFESPGAWGTVWEDLVELAQRDPALWEYIADALLTWCRRGVDGFRCDAGYKVPAPAWQHIIARVREEFPDTLFLLEGLGGGWGDTEALLTDGGMQWAYSELFQEFSPQQVAGYLGHAHKQSHRVGTLVHYSETHDNDRLAKRGRIWSLLRNQLSALTSVNGGFGFTCGVEWLCAEKINVHSCRALAWGSEQNIVPELARLNALLADHPAFFDGAKLTRLSPSDSAIYALRRDSEEGRDSVLVLVNTDPEREHRLTLDVAPESVQHDLLSRWGEAPAEPETQPNAELRTGSVEALPHPPLRHELHDGKITFTLSCGAAHCLSATEKPVGLSGDAYRRARAQAAFALTALAQSQAIEHLGALDWRELAKQVETNPTQFLAALHRPGVRLSEPQQATKEVALPNDDRVPAQAAGCGSESRAPHTSAYAPVVEWTLADTKRVLLVPPGHWLLVRDAVPFKATLVPGASSRRPDHSLPTDGDCKSPARADSIPTANGHVACFAPQHFTGDATLALDRLNATPAAASSTIRFLPPEPPPHSSLLTPHSSALALLTNGAGAMARLCVDLGSVRSKYDCVLGANLHASVPVDRHVFVKRLRAWVNADGFITPLNADNLVAFTPGPPAHWRFVANAGDGRSVEIHLLADMVPGKNTTLLRFVRPPHAPALGRELPTECSVSLTVRFDIEDRSFHCETKRNPGSEHHLGANSHSLQGRAGFAFTPGHGRQLKVWADAGRYHHEGEWSVNVPHPNEATRGQEGCGDAYSPGWFELPLAKGASVTLAASAEAEEQFDLASFKLTGTGLTTQPPSPLTPALSPEERENVSQRVGETKRLSANEPAANALPLPKGEGRGEGKGSEQSPKASAAKTRALFDFITESAPLAEPPTAPRSQLELPGLATPPNATANTSAPPTFAEQLARAIRAFVVRRDAGKTVIAGYPWFLDWGRDTLICARGLLAAGLREEVKQILVTFGRFAENGTLPNAIYGDNASNRDTSDAPLWYGVVCEDFAAGELAIGHRPSAIHSTPVDASGRTIADVLRTIATGYLRGTPNGIRVDAASGLVWSPSHFTWMDTNYPASTPREGYPVEIQALWIRLLRQLDRLGVAPEDEAWSELVARAERSLNELFWLEDKGWFADCLLAKPGISARDAVRDEALRSNCLFPISLGLVSGERARRTVDAALRHLVVPGALRSLAPLPVTPPLPIHGAHGQLLNDPTNPYWGRYEGDEDTRRKPAYHNGTAWTWTFPVFCEALARAHDLAPEAVAAARAYLGSANDLLNTGCLGQLPEIVDGDAPHTQRGCDAQAWGATEVLRVWKLLGRLAAA
jgi:glycogen debranching enzyme